MGGRKPLPTQVKQIKGTLQPCRTNYHEPIPEGLLVEPPDYMPEGAKAMGLDQKPIKIDIEISSQITGFKMNTEHGERNSTTSKHCIQIISRKISHAVDRW